MNRARFAAFFAACTAIVLTLLSRHVEAYVGPGAGGGATGGMGVGAMIVIAIAGLLGLAILCGLAAALISAADRLKAWRQSRRTS